MDHHAWLLFIYQIPATPSTHRAYAWRKLKSLGALYLQNSIGVFPASEDLERALEALKAEVAERGGHVQLFHAAFSPGEAADLAERFRAQSEDEYGEFLEQCGDFHAELSKERGRHHFTFGELEENEAELQKLRSWLPRIEARDFFAAPSRDLVRKALEDCTDDFALFEREVEVASSAVSEIDAHPRRSGALT